MCKYYLKSATVKVGSEISGRATVESGTESRIGYREWLVLCFELHSIHLQFTI